MTVQQSLPGRSSEGDSQGSIDPQLIARLRLASRNVVRELGLVAQGSRRGSLSIAGCHALIELGLGGELTLLTLADRLRVDKAAASRVVKRLAARGFVRVSSGDQDRRVRFIQLTPKGRRELRAIDDSADSRVRVALEHVSASEIDTIVGGIERYSSALRRSRQRREFTIRRIARGDDAEISRVIRSVMAEYGAVGQGYSINDTEVDAMFDAYQPPRAGYFVLEHDGHVVGGGGIGPLAGGDTEICELRKMYLLREARGLGFGQDLVALCIDEARRLGYRRCYLETLDRMHEARSLYAKNGFQRLERSLGCTGHSGCDTWYSRDL